MKKQAPVIEPAKKITLEEALTYFKKSLENSIESDKAEILKGSVKMVTDPIYFFEWSNGYFNVAARLKVAENVLSEIARGEKEGFGIADIQEAFQKRALDGARWPSFSTSQTSNLAKLYMTQELSEMSIKLAEMIKHYTGRA